MSIQTNKDSCDAIKCLNKSYEGLCELGKGAFYFEDDFKAICMILPYGGYCRLPLDGSRAWEWDGNQEKPTIKPSILQSGHVYSTGEYVELWHGFLTDGRFQSC